MAETPVKDVFADEDLEEDQRVIDEAEEAEEQQGTQTAVSEAVSDDIEIVLAEAEAEQTEAEEPEAESTEEPPEEPPEDDELKSYSKKVQDRIARERRLVKRTREEAETAITTERARRMDAERRTILAHKNLTEVLLVNIDGQLKSKTTELKQLLEGGDPEGKQVDIQGELDDLRAKKREIEGARSSIAQQEAEFANQAKAVVSQAPRVTAETQSWIDANKWFGKKGFAAETLMARDLDIKLAAQRPDKGSREYMQKLDRLIRQEMPDLADKVKRAFRASTGVKTAVAPVSRGSVAGTNSSGKRRVTLDRADLQNMREHKLDPTNKEHVALYAREKLNLGV